jgi:hypothetical protein
VLGEEKTYLIRHRLEPVIRHYKLDGFEHLLSRLRIRSEIPLHDAIIEAKKLAGLEADADVRIEVLPEPTNFFEALFGDLDAEKEVRIGKGLDNMAPELMNIARRAARIRAVFDKPVTFMMPFELEIR